MIELTNEQNAKAVDLYEQSFYGKDGYNGAHDCFIDDALTNEQHKIFDLLKDPYLTQQQKGRGCRFISGHVVGSLPTLGGNGNELKARRYQY